VCQSLASPDVFQLVDINSPRLVGRTGDVRACSDVFLGSGSESRPRDSSPHVQTCPYRRAESCLWKQIVQRQDRTFRFGAMTKLTDMKKGDYDFLCSLQFGHV